MKPILPLLLFILCASTSAHAADTPSVEYHAAAGDGERTWEQSLFAGRVPTAIFGISALGR